VKPLVKFLPAAFLFGQNTGKIHAGQKDKIVLTGSLGNRSGKGFGSGQNPL